LIIVTAKLTQNGALESDALSDITVSVPTNFEVDPSDVTKGKYALSNG
jgi:hypothetical protein